MTMTTSTEPDAAGRPNRPDVPVVVTDGRQLRRERNRQAVVEALLDLYRQGNLRPSTEEIAARSGLSPRSLFRYFDDVDDLTRTAVRHQQERAQHLVPVGAGPHESLAHKVDKLVAQRFRLFDAVGNAAAADMLTSFESCRLLLGDQALSGARARAVVVLGLLAVLGPSR